MIKLINESWGWTGVEATEIISINDFGNILFKAKDNTFWRLCPEELSCEVIAGNRSELTDVLNEEDFKDEWEIFELTELARKTVGDLEPGEKYCLKLPLILGGQYDQSNLGKLIHDKLIAYSGEMAFRVRNLPDGQKFRILFD